LLTTTDITYPLTATSAAPSAINATPAQFGTANLSPRKYHSKYNDKNDAEFVDGRNPGRIAQFKCSEIANP